MKLNKDSFVPQYHQLKNIILNQIKSDSLKHGDKIPTESQLCKEYNISKITTSKAISELVMGNILYREQGRGTFVVGKNNKKKKTGLIGLVLPGDIAGMFSSTIIEGINYTLDLNSFHQIVKFSGDSAQKERKCISELIKLNVDGIILAINHPSDSKKNVEFLIKEKIPFVLIDKYIPELDTDYVVFDSFKAGHMATEYLINRGHKRIAFVSVDKFSSRKENLDGYHAALKESGLDTDTYVVKSETDQTDYEAIEKLLNMKTLPTGIVTYHIAETEKAIKAKGLKIPADISVIGYHRHKNYYDSFTCVDFFIGKMASQAAEILINKVKDIEIKEKHQIKIKPVLVQGNSVSEIGREEVNKNVK